MMMHPVKSSALQALGYSPETKTMRVLLKSGAIYDHGGVSQAQFDAQRSAKSIGAHYAKNHGKGGVKVERAGILARATGKDFTSHTRPKR